MNFIDISKTTKSQKGLVLTVLDENRPPQNGRQVAEEITTYLAFTNAEHLLYEEFNVSTEARAKDDHMARLRRAKEKAKGRLAEGLTARSESVKVEAEVKSEYNVGSMGVAVRLVDKQVRFRDAILYEAEGKDEPEPVEDRIRRMQCWSLLTKCFANHPQLYDPSVCEHGNISRLMGNFMELISVHEKENALDTIVKVCGLKARGKTWKNFMAEVQSLKAEVDRVEDPEYRVSEKVVTQFVLRAMGEVPEYQVEVGLLRKMKGEPSLTVVLAELDARSMRTGNRTMGGITGMIGECGTDQLEAFKAVAGGLGLKKRDSRGRGPRPCWEFSDTGSCKRGDECNYAHFSDSKCYECGSDKHGRDECPELQDRKSLQAFLKSNPRK